MRAPRGAAGNPHPGRGVRPGEPLPVEWTLPRPIPQILYGHISYGQSLSIGAGGRPALSLTQPYMNLTFDGGPKATLIGNGFGGRNQSAMAAAGSLVEDDRSPDDLDTRGETFCSSAVNGAVELAEAENGVPPSSFVWFSSACGRGGEPIRNLLPTSTPQAGRTQNFYANFIDHVQRAAAISERSGRTYILAVVNIAHGEADASADCHGYKRCLAELIDSIQSDALALTGQRTKPHILFTQQGFGIRKSPSGGPAQAMFELARDRPDCHLVTPIYHLPFAEDGIHLLNVGYLRGGRTMAAVMKAIVVDGVKPRTLFPLSAVAEGTEVRLKFMVPGGSIVLDTNGLPPTRDMGFAVVAGGRSVEIRAISVDRPDVLLVELAEPLRGEAEIRAGLDYLAKGLTIMGGASTNLRYASHANGRRAFAGFPSWTPCPHFRMPILPAPQTP